LPWSKRYPSNALRQTEDAAMPATSTIARLLRLLALSSDPTGAQGLRSGLRLPALWLKRARARHVYGALTPEQMHDAGLNPERLAREAAKPFWQD
jgi:uncharacterized protein YjiS (DUF1127 family)